MRKISMTPVIIIGAGLAGCEAAWQIARHGIPVELFEMRPQRMTPAHQSDRLGELVCSNSLRGTGMHNAVGLLKEELRRCRSLFITAADAHAVPAGGALAVDREAFADHLTSAITRHPLITLHRQEITAIPEEGLVIIASGPLTSDALAGKIAALTGQEHLYFYDAIAPIVEADSIDRDQVYAASRYDQGGADYLNCPFDREQYLAFVDNLCKADKVAPHDFEKVVHFEGCMPIEVLAERGEMTLAFGPMKPVGLRDPRTGREPFAVVQLRQDDRHANLYNLVGFQTKLTYPEQRRIFRTIPGLENASFARLGSMHRNTFINAPACLTATLQLRARPKGLLCRTDHRCRGLRRICRQRLPGRAFCRRLLPGEEFPATAADYGTRGPAQLSCQRLGGRLSADEYHLRSFPGTRAKAPQTPRPAPGPG